MLNNTPADHESIQPSTIQYILKNYHECLRPPHGTMTRGTNHEWSLTITGCSLFAYYSGMAIWHRVWERVCLCTVGWVRDVLYNYFWERDLIASTPPPHTHTHPHTQVGELVHLLPPTHIHKLEEKQRDRQTCKLKWSKCISCQSQWGVWDIHTLTHPSARAKLQQTLI